MLSSLLRRLLFGLGLLETRATLSLWCDRSWSRLLVLSSWLVSYILSWISMM
jgi:hypothetical protein